MTASKAADCVHGLLSVDDLTGAELLHSFLDFSSDVGFPLVLCGEQAKPLADDLGRVLVHAALELAADEIFELGSECDVHGGILAWMAIYVHNGHRNFKAVA